MSVDAKVQEYLKKATSVVFIPTHQPIKTIYPLVVLGFPDKSGTLGYSLLKILFMDCDLKIKIASANNTCNISLINSSNERVADISNLSFNSGELETFKSLVSLGSKIGLMVSSENLNQPLTKSSIFIQQGSPDPFMTVLYEKILIS